MLICVSADQMADLVAGHLAIPCIDVDRILVQCGEQYLRCRVVNSGLDRTNKTLMLSLVRASEPGDAHAPADTAEAVRPAAEINAVANGEADPADDYDYRQHAAVRQSFAP